jgi:eukaryotic-like serine/threonine-protein kinase
MAKSIKPWAEKWNILTSLSGGGQCDNFKVEDKSGQLLKTYVLKCIKNKNNPERRSRFYREVHNNLSLDHPNIPKVIDHNCDDENLKNCEVPLYLVYEYIEGITLDTFVKDKSNNRLSLAESVQIVSKLCDILSYCHDEGITHRDIKPDNIMLRNHSITDIVVIDFGLSASKEDSIISNDEQLGNRFLFLEELKYNSQDKRNYLSDLTYIVGVFFFLLTKEYPWVLSDEQGRLPHQRVDFATILNELQVSENQKAIIYKIFDIGFQRLIKQRFESIFEFKEYLNKLSMNDDNDSFDYKAYLKNISPTLKIKNQERLQSVLHAIHKVFQNAIYAIGLEFPDISIGVGGPSVQSHHEPMQIIGHFSFKDQFNHSVNLNFEVTVVIIGVEFELIVKHEKSEKILQRFSTSEEVNESTKSILSEYLLMKYAEKKMSLTKL